MSRAKDRAYVLRVVRQLIEQEDPLGVAEILYAAGHHVRCDPKGRKQVVQAVATVLNTIDAEGMADVVRETEEQEETAEELSAMSDARGALQALGVDERTADKIVADAVEAARAKATEPASAEVH